MRITEDNFVQQLKNQNELALSYVIDKYGAFIMAVIRKHLSALPGYQEECMNDVLFAVWNHISSYDESKGSFKNWIAAIARFQSIDYLRKYKSDLRQTPFDDLKNYERNRCQGFLEKEFSDEVQKLIKCLKPVDREIFRRLYLEEESFEQISKAMEMEKSVLYNRVSRGKKRMRDWHGGKRRG